MKKILIALTALAMCAGSAFAVAFISVDWSAGALLGHDGNTDGVLASEDTDYLMWDLVWSSSDASVVGTIGFDDVTGKYSYRDGDEVVSSRLVKTDGSVAVTDSWPTEKSSSDLTVQPWWEIIGEGSAQFITESYETDAEGTAAFPHTSGYFYSVVFQYCTDGSVYYKEVEPVAAHILGRPETDFPDAVNFDLESDTTIDRFLGKTVPEPATMSLLGLGALAMVLRRKLRK